MPKRATKREQKPSTPSLHLWLVPFWFERPKKKKRGTFQMVVEASNPDGAMERCWHRLQELASTTELFVEPIKIYSDGLLRLTGRFDGAVLLNFELADAKGRISSLMPDQPEHEVMMFATNRRSGPIEPFLTFGLPKNNGRPPARDIN